MTVQLSPLAVQRFVDNNGNALAGGQLYTYQAGTSTPLPTYTDSTGLTANTNPIVLNARGEANIWLTLGQAYKFALYDSLNNLIWTVDNTIDSGSALAANLASTTNATLGSTLVGWFKSLANFVGRTLSAKLSDQYSVCDYGAVGDGATNNAAFLANCPPTDLLVPPGTYLVNSNTTIATNLRFASGAVLKPASGATITLSAAFVAPQTKIFDLSLGGAVILGAAAPIVFAEWWGADPTGSAPSDAAISSALTASVASKATLVIPGSLQVLNTVNQPTGSAVNILGNVFCSNPAGLTNSVLWSVNSTSSIAKTRIIRGCFSTTADPTNYKTAPQSIIGLQASGVKVELGEIYTYGCRAGGVVLGPTGYEISARLISCEVLTALLPSPTAVGVKFSTSDCLVDKLVTAGYAIGIDASASGDTKIGIAHVWGLPADSANSNPNQQLTTGVLFGNETFISSLFVDTLDTATYGTAPSGNAGYGLVFTNYNSRVLNLSVLISTQSASNNVRLMHFEQYTNCVFAMNVFGSFDVTNAFIYDGTSQQWNNYVLQTVTSSGTLSVYSYALPLPAGVTSMGAYVYKVYGYRTHRVSLHIYLPITGVDTGVVGAISVNLPPGMSVPDGYSCSLTQYTAISGATTQVIGKTASNQIVFFSVSAGGALTALGINLYQVGNLEFTIDLDLDS